MELRVNPVLPLDIKYSDFWPHVIDSWRKKGIRVNLVACAIGRRVGRRIDRTGH